jgi:hypothetical protein
MNLRKDDRVTLLKLDGIGGTVTNIRGDGRVAVLADCATQPVVWERSELGPPPRPRPRQERKNDG